MDMPTTSAIITGAIGSAGGALTMGWFSKILIKKFIADNDRRHAVTDAAIAKVADNLGLIAVELSAIQVSLAQVTLLKEQIQKDHDTVIELKTWNAKYHDDLKAQFGKIRRIENDCNDMGRVISGLRRGASNGQ